MGYKSVMWVREVKEIAIPSCICITTTNFGGGKIIFPENRFDAIMYVYDSRDLTEDQILEDTIIGKRLLTAPKSMVVSACIAVIFHICHMNNRDIPVEALRTVDGYLDAGVFGKYLYHNPKIFKRSFKNIREAQSYVGVNDLFSLLVLRLRGIKAILI